MKWIRLALIGTALAAQQVAIAQTETAQVLKIGDQMPDIAFSVQHYRTPTASLHQFRGKYLILDLWNVGCSSCIANMPRLEKIQQQYADKLEILKVTRDTEEEIKTLFKKSQVARDCRLPSVIGDVKISGLINSKYLPTYVLIDKDGKLQYIAGSLTNDDIERFIHDKPVSFTNSIDAVLMTYKNPMIIDWYPYTGNNFEGQSYLAKYDTRYSTRGGMGITPSGRDSLKGATLRVCLIKDFYSMVYNKEIGSNFSKSRILLESDNARGLQFDSTGKEQRYIYELTLKQGVPKDAFYNYLQKQFDFYFNVRSGWERRNMPCYIIKRIADVDIKSKETFIQSDDYTQEKKHVRKYVQWKYIFNTNVQILAPYQIIDESGIDPLLRVDMTLYFDWDNLPRMNEQLKKYGLKIEKDQRVMEVIVIKNA